MQQSTHVPKAWLPIFALTLISLVGLFLRWYRLDIISFRYDTAEAMFRAREIARGHLPLLGITNSLGFRNPPGLPWAILPPLLVSASPQLATAWFGLLCLSGIVPLYLICRCWLGDWSFVLPCTAYALLPNQVFADRTIWAQWLMIPIFTWVLWLLLSTLRPGRRSSATSAIVVLALTWYGIAVHLSGLAYLPIVIVAIVAAGRKAQWSLAVVARITTVGCLPLLMLVPSGLDYLNSRQHPIAKPAHVTKFESLMPPPDAFGPRLKESLSGQFNLFANAVQADDILSLPECPGVMLTRRLVQVADALLLVLAGTGIALCGLALSRKHTHDITESTLSKLLLSWIFLPTIAGCAALSRANGSYFAPAVPALLLMLAVGPARFAKKFPGFSSIGSIAGLLSGCIYPLFCLQLMGIISHTSFVIGQYYIPLKDQMETARQLAAHGVSVHRLVHLSGDWYQRPYDYLLSEVLHSPEVTEQPSWAVLEDKNLRLHQPARAKFFHEKAQYTHGSVESILFETPEAGRQFVNTYYDIPIEGKGID